MLNILPDDMFGVVLINPGIPLQNLRRRQPTFCQDEDILLVFQGDLGVGDKDRRNQGMCSAALPAAYPLDRECKEFGWEFDLSLVPAVENETSLLMACTFDGKEVKGLKKSVIKIIRKRLVRKKENRYHNPCLLQET